VVEDNGVEFWKQEVVPKIDSFVPSLTTIISSIDKYARNPELMIKERSSWHSSLESWASIAHNIVDFSFHFLMAHQIPETLGMLPDKHSISDEQIEIAKKMVKKYKLNFSKTTNTQKKRLMVQDHAVEHKDIIFVLLKQSIIQNENLKKEERDNIITDMEGKDQNIIEQILDGKNIPNTIYNAAKHSCEIGHAVGTADKTLINRLSRFCDNQPQNYLIKNSKLFVRFNSLVKTSDMSESKEFEDLWDKESEVSLPKLSWRKERVRALIDGRDWNEYYRGQGIIDDVIGKMNGTRIITLKHVGAMGKTAMAYEIIKIKSENDEFEYYPIMTSKTKEQGELDLRHFNRERTNDDPMDRRFGAATNYVSNFEELIKHIARLSDDYRDTATNEVLETIAIKFLATNKVLLTIDNYEDIEFDENELEKYNQFFHTFFTQKHTSFPSKIIITTRSKGYGTIETMKALNRSEREQLLKLRLDWLRTKMRMEPVSPKLIQEFEKYLVGVTDAWKEMGRGNDTDDLGHPAAVLIVALYIMKGIPLKQLKKEISTAEGIWQDFFDYALKKSLDFLDENMKACLHDLAKACINDPIFQFNEKNVQNWYRDTRDESLRIDKSNDFIVQLKASTIIKNASLSKEEELMYQFVPGVIPLLFSDLKRADVESETPDIEENISIGAEEGGQDDETLDDFENFISAPSVNIDFLKNQKTQKPHIRETINRRDVESSTHIKRLERILLLIEKFREDKAEHKQEHFEDIRTIIFKYELDAHKKLFEIETKKLEGADTQSKSVSALLARYINYDNFLILRSQESEQYLPDRASIAGDTLKLLAGNRKHEKQILNIVSLLERWYSLKKPDKMKGTDLSDNAEHLFDWYRCWAYVLGGGNYACESLNTLAPWVILLIFESGEYDGKEKLKSRLKKNLMEINDFIDNEDFDERSIPFISEFDRVSIQKVLEELLMNKEFPEEGEKYYISLKNQEEDLLPDGRLYYQFNVAPEDAAHEYKLTINGLRGDEHNLNKDDYEYVVVMKDPHQWGSRSILIRDNNGELIKREISEKIEGKTLNQNDARNIIKEHANKIFNSPEKMIGGRITFHEIGGELASSIANDKSIVHTYREIKIYCNCKKISDYGETITTVIWKILFEIFGDEIAINQENDDNNQNFLLVNKLVTLDTITSDEINYEINDETNDK